MAQDFRLEYLGSVEVKANKEYNATDFEILYPSADFFIMKTKTTSQNAVKVSIDASPAFRMDYNEKTAYTGVTSRTYVFNKDCIILVAKEKTIV